MGLDSELIEAVKEGDAERARDSLGEGQTPTPETKVA